MISNNDGGMSKLGIVPVFLACFVSSTLGVTFGSMSTNKAWKDWCIQRGYAEYDSKTGVVVYKEMENVESTNGNVSGM